MLLSRLEDIFFCGIGKSFLRLYVSEKLAAFQGGVGVSVIAKRSYIQFKRGNLTGR
jgi:hypothetical protein